MRAEPYHIDLFYRFRAALLVGLQRAYSLLQQKEYEKLLGGLRTHALPGLPGCTAAFIAGCTGPLLAFGLCASEHRPGVAIPRTR